MNEEEIKKLPSALRLAGYIKTNAALSELGAKLRLAKEDEEWTKEEEAEWDKLCDEIDPWFYALTDSERKLLSEGNLEDIMGKVARGENCED